MAEHPARAGRPRTVAAVVVAGLVLAAAAIAAGAAVGVTGQVLVETYTLTNLVIGLGFLGPGAVIAWFRWANPVGRLMLVCGAGHLVSAASGMLVLVALDADLPIALVRVLVTLHTGAWQVGLVCLFSVVLLLFPDGHLPSRRWRPVVWLVLLSGAYQLVTGVLSDTPVPLGGDPRAQSALSIGLVVPDGIVETAGLVNAGLVLATTGALVVRYRRGPERVRSQVLWLLLAVLAMLVLNTQRWLTGDGPILLLLSFCLVPTAIAIAIVRHRLLDVRFVLSRTLLYVLAVSLLVAVYAGGVAVVSLLVPGAERGLSIVVAIVVAIGFTPVRLLLQRIVDRAFYGARADPAGAAVQVGERLRRDDDLAGVLENARRVLRLPHLAVLSRTDGTELAAAGDRPRPVEGAGEVDLPLVYRGSTVATLRVALRRGDSELHDDDRRTLDLVGLPLAVALHATALSEQVQLARAVAVETGERERVRLQRDLHDGLGPTLTSIAFRADAASNVVRADPDRAEALLTDIRSGLRTALDDVRRVVHDLRPLDLETLGLLGAVRRSASQLEGGGAGGPTIEVHAPTDLLTPSPAVELAAYRIATEAMANVVRHSDATRCTVALDASAELTLVISDDGSSSGPWRPGVGMRSMAERAEELGGAVVAGPTPSGWRVEAHLPMQAAGSALPAPDPTADVPVPAGRPATGPAPVGPAAIPSAARHGEPAPAATS